MEASTRTGRVPEECHPVDKHGDTKLSKQSEYNIQGVSVVTVFQAWIAREWPVENDKTFVVVAFEKRTKGTSRELGTF